MNIYRVRYQTSEIFYVPAETFYAAVQLALRLGKTESLTLVEYLGPVRNS